MKVTISKQIGKAQLQVDVEGKDAEEALVHAAGITTMPDHCGLCKSEDVELTSNKAQEKYTYVKVRCSKCTATSTMGKYQDGSGIFWKAFEVFKKDQE